MSVPAFSRWIQVLCFAAAALTATRVVTAQSDDSATLEKTVEELRDRNAWDRALEIITKYMEAHPQEAGGFRVRRLLASTKELAREADALFQKELRKAESQLGEGNYGPAIATASNASRWYPERTATVKDLRDRALKLKAGQNLIRVAAGTYRIGSDRLEDENPGHVVTLRAFLIDKYQVTNEDYLGFISETGHEAPAHWVSSKPPKGRERHPVVQVSWLDALTYARWLGKRLPTAEEWEAAATGSQKREFPWGNRAYEQEDVFPCNCLEYWQVNSTQSPGTLAVDFFDKLRPAGSPSLSMGGNVWDWTNSVAPGKVGDVAREFRILKGGSFMTPINAVRCSDSYAENPKLAHPDVGFRCAKDVD